MVRKANKVGTILILLPFLLAWSIPSFATELRFLTVGHTPEARNHLQTAVLPVIEQKLGVTITMEEANWNTRSDKIVLSIAGGVPFDVVSTGNEAPWSEGAIGMLEPLNRYVDRWALKGRFPEALWRAARWDGKIYHIPHTIDLRGIGYNKRLFAEAGLNPAQPPDSWEELIKAARRLTRLEGDRVAVRGYFMAANASPGTAQDFYWFAHQAGIPVVDVEGFTSNLNRAEARDALYALTELAAAGRYGEPLVRGNDGLIQETAAMAKGIVTNVLANMRRQNPGLVEDFGIFAPRRYPQSPPVAHGFINGLAILAESHEKDLAWGFIEAMHEPGLRGEFERVTNNLSGRIDLVPQILKSTPELSLFFDLIPHLVSTITPPGNSGVPTRVQQVHKGELSPEAALTHMHESMGRLMNEWKVSLGR